MVSTTERPERLKVLIKRVNETCREPLNSFKNYFPPESLLQIEKDIEDTEKMIMELSPLNERNESRKNPEEKKNPKKVQLTRQYQEDRTYTYKKR